MRTKSNITIRDSRKDKTPDPTGGQPLGQGFRAKRQPALNIEMVLIEKPALLTLVSLAKTFVDMVKEGKMEPTDASMHHALEVATMLGQEALGIKERTDRIAKRAEFERYLDETTPRNVQ